jgi:hypothetical protein
MRTSPSPMASPRRARALVLVLAWLALSVVLLAIKLFTARAGFADDPTQGIVVRSAPSLASWEALGSTERTLYWASENGSAWTSLHRIVTAYAWWMVPTLPFLGFLGHRGARLLAGRPIGVLVALAALQTVMVAGLAIRIVQVGRMDLDVRWLGLLPLAGAIVAGLALRRGSKPHALRVAVLVFSLAVAGFLAVAHQRGRPAVAAGARR